MNNKSSASSRRIRNHLLLIAIEMAVCFGVIYTSIYFNWPQHDYLRYTVLLPLYQASVFYGYSGGIIGGAIAALLFIPIIPLDPLIKDVAYGTESAIIMIAFILFFGVFIGGIIGAALSAQRHVEGLSRVSLSLSHSVTQVEVLKKLATEAANMVGAECAAVLTRPEEGGNPSVWEIFVTAGGIDGKFTPVPGFSGDNVMVWSAHEKQALASHSAAADDRLDATAGADAVRSLMVAPVAFENKVYASVLVANKKNDYPFSENDFSALKMLAESAGGNIQNIEQEIRRQEEKMREEQMRDLFSRFVSSSVADYILKNPELLSGSQREVTVLVSDIRDFTRISETLPARELVALLNEYFTNMVDVIHESMGTIDKFIGDCIIAYWGAPAPDPRHAVNAARTALSMSRRLDVLAEKWSREGKPSFQTGIALHTCSVLMGNVGDERKRAFTIMGEEVENAIRIESLTKKYGARIIATEKTAAGAGSAFAFETLTAGAADGYGELFLLRSEDRI